jgi:hypothetical protein
VHSTRRVVFIIGERNVDKGVLVALSKAIALPVRSGGDEESLKQRK